MFCTLLKVTVRVPSLCLPSAFLYITVVNGARAIAEAAVCKKLMRLIVAAMLRRKMEERLRKFKPYVQINI